MKYSILVIFGTLDNAFFPMWSAISNLGDAALTLPLALACATWLATANRRVAAQWMFVLLAGMVLVGTTKVLYAGCGIQVESIGFRVISGHTMLSSAIWPVALMLVMHGWSRHAEMGVVAGLVLGAAIGTARVFDDAHTVSEVVAGWLIGSALAVLFARRFARANITPRSPAVAAAGLLLVSSVAYGHHAPFEAMIELYSPGICGRFLQ